MSDKTHFGFEEVNTHFGFEEVNPISQKKLAMFFILLLKNMT